MYYFLHLLLLKLHFFRNKIFNQFQVFETSYFHEYKTLRLEIFRKHSSKVYLATERKEFYNFAFLLILSSVIFK